MSEKNRWGLAMMDALGEACEKEMESWSSEEREQAKENLKNAIDRAVEIGNQKHHIKGGTDYSHQARKEKTMPNDIFKWVADHPDVELMMTTHHDSFIVQLTHVDSRYRLKHAFFIDQMEPYILDVLYDELKRRIGMAVFMEESDGE